MALKRQSSRRRIQRKFPPTLDDQCCNCGTSKRNGARMTIQHIDGNPYNNEGNPHTYPETGEGNLKYMCVDCHSQEDYDEGRWGHLGDVGGQ